MLAEEELLLKLVIPSQPIFLITFPLNNFSLHSFLQVAQPSDLFNYSKATGSKVLKLISVSILVAAKYKSLEI